MGSMYSAIVIREAEKRELDRMVISIANAIVIVSRYSGQESIRKELLQTLARLTGDATVVTDLRPCKKCKGTFIDAGSTIRDDGDGPICYDCKKELENDCT